MQMYYELINLNKDESVKSREVVTITRIEDYMRLTKKYDEVNLIMPKVAVIKPESMIKYSKYGWNGRHQSFHLETTDGEKLSFFNIDNFHKLYKVFIDKTIIYYESKRGREHRQIILATKNGFGDEFWFER